MYNARHREEAIAVGGTHRYRERPLMQSLGRVGAKHLLTLCGVCSSALIVDGRSYAQCEYDVTVIQGPWCGEIFEYPPTLAKGVNECGDVVGYYSECLIGPNKAFLWTADSGLVTLNLPGAIEAVAEDVSGQRIVGFFNDPNDEFGSLAFLRDGANVIPIIPPGATLSHAHGVNGVGQVVGSSSGASGGQAFLWQDGVLTTIGPLEVGAPTARDLNNSGQIVGYAGNTSHINPTARAFIWDDLGITMLDAIPGALTSLAQAINENGQVVGYGLFEIPELTVHSFIWSDGHMTDLGTLPGFLRSFALDINDRGTVVGYNSYFDGNINIQHAVIWQNGVMTDLNELIPSGLDLIVKRARAINNNGQIVGRATLDGYAAVAFLLTPVNVPTGDVDGDCSVGILDFLFLIGNWGTCPPEQACFADFDGNGLVDLADFMILLNNWGE